MNRQTDKVRWELRLVTRDFPSLAFAVGHFHGSKRNVLADRRGLIEVSVSAFTDKQRAMRFAASLQF